MSLIWREQLSVSNDAIDSDHKHLVEIINQVEHVLKKKSQQELATVLNELGEYSQLHFAREEKIADAAGYPEVPRMHASHKTLLNELEQMRGEFDAVGQEWSTEAAEHFTNFLRSWLVDHVIKEDLLMKPTLEKLSPRFYPL